MVARVVMVQIQPGKTGEAIDIYQDSVVPAAKQQQGVRGALLLTDPETDTGISVTLWERETDMIAGETSGYYQEQITKFRTVFGAPPMREHYEVNVQG